MQLQYADVTMPMNSFRFSSGCWLHCWSSSFRQHFVSIEANSVPNACVNYSHVVKTLGNCHHSLGLPSKAAGTTLLSLLAESIPDMIQKFS